jgi:orotidine-5'-phosphate decarboxylase
VTAGFGGRLRAAVAAHGPLCVGIDPHPELLTSWGLSVDGPGAERFARSVVEALAGEVALLKPQSAHFEAFGSAGIAALERVLADCRAAGVLALLDAKRGDIGSTMGAYARAYLTEGSPLAADAVTVSPYLGFGSLSPAFEAARETGRGVFVLALTSNPEGASVQRAVLSRPAGAGRSVAQQVVDGAAREGGAVGVVIGATVGPHELDLTRFSGRILVPGFGAQGAGVAELAEVFGPARAQVLPASARGVLRHGPDPGVLRSAVRQINGDLAASAEAPLDPRPPRG